MGHIGSCLAILTALTVSIASLTLRSDPVTKSAGSVYYSIYVMYCQASKCLSEEALKEDILKKFAVQNEGEVKPDRLERYALIQAILLSRQEELASLQAKEDGKKPLIEGLAPLESGGLLGALAKEISELQKQLVEVAAATSPAAPSPPPGAPNPSPASPAPVSPPPSSPKSPPTNMVGQCGKACPVTCNENTLTMCGGNGSTFLPSYTTCIIKTLCGKPGTLGCNNAKNQCIKCKNACATTK